MKPKDILIFIVAVALIAGGVIGLFKLFGNESKNEYGTSGTNPGEEEVYIPVYLTTEEALEIANDLYSKAEIITYDPLSYPEYKFDASDKTGYTNKITNYTYITSNIFKDTTRAITKEQELDTTTGALYINNALAEKNEHYIKTELQLRENDENRIVFNAVSTYCRVVDRVCTEEEIPMYKETRTYDFIITKHNGIWKVEAFTLPY